MKWTQACDWGRKREIRTCQGSCVWAVRWGVSNIDLSLYALITKHPWMVSIRESHSHLSFEGSLHHPGLGANCTPPARQPLLTITRQPTSLHLFTHFPPSEVTHPSHQATRCNCNSQRLAHNLEKTLFKSIYQFEDKHISMLSPQSLEQTRMLHYSTSWYFIEAEEEVKTCPQLWRWQERSWRL